MTIRRVMVACLVAVTVVLVTIAWNQAYRDSDSAAARTVAGTSVPGPGGKAQPLTIDVGKAFEFAGLHYKDGWYVVASGSRKLEIADFKAHNRGNKKATHGFEMTFTRGAKVVASASCITALLPPDDIDRVKCVSADTWPAKYDKVTVHETF
jgi:hypothetical protein